MSIYLTHEILIFLWWAIFIEGAFLTVTTVIMFLLNILETKVLLYTIFLFKTVALCLVSYFLDHIAVIISK